MKKKRIEESVYGSYIYLVWGCPRKEIIRWLNRKSGLEFEEKDEFGTDTFGSTFIIRYEDRTDLYIWVNNKKNIPSLVHELSHVVYHTLSSVGIQHNDDTDEAYAYLLTFYVRECLKALK